MAILCSGCATVAPGEGFVSESSRERLDWQRRASEGEAVRLALAAAEKAPNDLRAQRRAAELLTDYLRRAREPARSTTYLRAEGTLARLEASEAACETRLEAGRVREAADDVAGATQNYVQTARECSSVAAFQAAALPLRKLSRCAEVVELAAQVWPAAEVAERVAVMDEVAACSDAKTLRKNLAFAAPDVVVDYLALIQARERAAMGAR